jgi:uncharacterized protein
VLAYVATKSRFLDDAPQIEDLIQASVAEHLGLHIRTNSPEYVSWRNSLGNAMFHVVNTATIPDNAGIAIEYRLHGRRQRIDFMISGVDGAGRGQLVLIELKQWTNVSSSELFEHVTTFLGGSRQTVQHPSYQAWSYARLLKDFYEVVSSGLIQISPCAYLHNCDDEQVVKDVSIGDLLVRAPLFLKADRMALRRFIEMNILRGDDTAVIRQIEKSRIEPSKQLVESLASMLKGNEEFVLIDEQKTAFEVIMARVGEVRVGQRLVLIVKGGPGTGKSVIAINALVRLLDRNLNARYVTKNAAPRGVYQAKLKGKFKRAEIGSLFVGSDAFFQVEPDSYDVLLVDEAHRLVEKSGLYKNLGENQVREVMKSARITVFFVDEGQLVTWRDIGTLDEIRRNAASLGVEVEEYQLEAQFRCAGSDEYLKWVNSVLGGEKSDAIDLSSTMYEIEVMDSPSDLRDLIYERNRSNNRSRILAGYCWKWVSKREPRRFDIEFPGTDFAMRWNLEKDGSMWMVAPNSVHEVGCIHTSQGLEGDYMGVIIGPDLKSDCGKLITDPKERASSDQSLRGIKQASILDETGALDHADCLIRNTYRTLLTRGSKGTFIYCTDSGVTEILRQSLRDAHYGNQSIQTEGSP